MKRVNWAKIQDKAEEFIIGAAKDVTRNGINKKDAVIDQIIDFLDDEVFVFEGNGAKFKEIATDVVLKCLRFVLGLLVQDIYDRLKLDGRV